MTVGICKKVKSIHNVNKYKLTDIDQIGFNVKI